MALNNKKHVKLIFVLFTGIIIVVGIFCYIIKKNYVIYSDFNFDKINDLAIRSNEYGPYGSTSYNIYLYDKKAYRFRKNQQLTKLENTNLVFYPEEKSQKIITFTKSGCCYHIQTEYIFEHNGKLKKIASHEQIANDELILGIIRQVDSGKYPRTEENKELLRDTIENDQVLFIDKWLENGQWQVKLRTKSQ